MAKISTTDVATKTSHADAPCDECNTLKKLADDRLKQLQYLQSDFDNLKKESYKQKTETITFANKELITSLLPFLDSLDKAITTDASDGLKKLYQQFYQILEKNGLKKIEAVGKPANPYYHEVIVREKSAQPDGIILEELQKGYLLNSKIIRNSKVKVSHNPSATTEKKSSPADKPGGNKNG